MAIFSYHLSLPAAFFRLKGLKRLCDMLSVGSVTDMLLSRMFWLRLKVPLSVSPTLLNVLLYDTLLVRVLCV